MQDEQDRDLNAWLSCYRVKEDEASDKALLKRIVAVASATPRETRKPFWSRLWASTWVADAAAFAAVAALGFWIGTVSPHNSVGEITTAASTSASDGGDFDQMLFGAQSWKEVAL